MSLVPVAGTLAALLTLPAAPALATLGEQYAPARGLAPSAAPAPTFIAHPRLLASGTRIVEYVNGEGTVFAVSWTGPFLPDLRDLLGRHFAALVLQQARDSHLHAPVVVRDGEVVIYTSGGMGAFDGRAWLPRSVPAGFDPRAL